MRQLYDTKKKLSGNRRKPERPVKSKEGEVITNIEEQRNRWVEHFKELLNRPAPLNPPNIETAPTHLPINVGPPTIEEINQIATLRIIVEQSIEWNSSLYINFIDYEKAFDSVDRTTLWKLLRHYGVLQKIANIIQNSYDGLKCKFVHAGQLIKSFEVKTGVRQGCLLSPFLFLLVIDWIMKTSTSEGKHGIQWTSRMQLDDLDFADDLVLLSQTQQQMQEKTTSVLAASSAIGLNMHKGKSKVLRYDTACTNPITIDGEDLEDVKTFTYLGSIIDEHGGSDADVKVPIGKNKPDPSGGRNQEEALEVDKTHIGDSTQSGHKTSPHMESSRPKEERKTKEHITPGNGDRHEKNEQELDGIRKGGPGQSGLENAHRRPMLHWE
ncbi:unnamed protein product [Schistosoma margrebowiei]|uniref:Uncharacterized protein n=1 Tax=Schistosoma margrebowiei TaxID=48269 RepID=A0A183LY12_9TREM|nr:unnamed protein product [Schistosoma margrebowiei]